MYNQYIKCDVGIIISSCLKDETIMKTYLERMRELREDRDLHQKDIAKVLQITQQTYSRYEKGINELPVRHVILLCKFYHVSADYFLGMSDQP